MKVRPSSKHSFISLNILPWGSNLVYNSTLFHAKYLIYQKINFISSWNVCDNLLEGFQSKDEDIKYLAAKKNLICTGTKFQNLKQKKVTGDIKKS